MLYPLGVFQIQKYMRKNGMCLGILFLDFAWNLWRRIGINGIYDHNDLTSDSLMWIIFPRASQRALIFPKLILLFFTQVAFVFTVLMHLILLHYQTFDVFHCTIFVAWILNTFHDESEFKNKLLAIVLSLDGT